MPVYVSTKMLENCGFGVTVGSRKIYVGCVCSPGARIEVSNRARNSVQKAVMSVSNQRYDLYVLGSMGLFDKQPRRRL